MVALFVAFTLAFGAICARLVILQIVEAPAYAAMAQNQRERTIEYTARRGAIFDRDGEPLAISVNLQTIFADPALIEDPVAVAQALAPIIDRDYNELLAILQEDSQFEFLVRQAEPAVTRQVKALELPGIFMRVEPKRYYPNGSLGSHLLGFADIDGKGLAGVELQYEEILKGLPGLLIEQQDPSGRALPSADFTERRPKPGRSLFLTIDKELQYFTELTLADAVEDFSAVAGTAIVLRPGTGEILAMANVPTFDPNEPGERPEENLRNRAITDVYEPGSAYKIVTASGALEDGVVTPLSAFDVPDAFPYADRVFHDSHAHPPARMTVREIIEQSSNVGTIKIGLQLGGKRLDHYVHRFGFGSKTGLDFPGESPGIVIDRKDWSGSTIATIPIGQGIAVTALQMASAYAALANGGVWAEPKLLYASMGANNKVEASAPAGTQRVISEKTSKQMTRILSGVVTDGTGTLASIPGYQVAGKTGTAQKALPGGGYGQSYVGSFAGFAPANDPQLVAIVVLDEPSPIWGGLTAAPTFRTIMEFALRHLGISPSGNAEKAAREIEASHSVQSSAHD